MSDRKRMKKQHEKRIKGWEKQVDKHEGKLRTEKGMKDTTPRYWEEEIDEFKGNIKKSKKYLGEH